MSRFSPSDAALEGFRLTRERPLSVLAWAALRLAYGVGLIAVMTILGWSAKLAAFQALAPAGAQADMSRVGSVLGALAPMVVLMIVIGLLFYAIAYTAVLRAILRPSDKAFFYLRLSVDEVRQLGLALLFFVIFFVYALVIEVISIILIALAKGLGQAATPVQILLVFAVAAAFIYPAVRLSLAPAMTFADGRISLFRALPLTRGRFWPMLGAYILALILTLVVGLLASVIFVLATMALGAAQGGLANLQTTLQAVLQARQVELGDLSKPAVAASVVFGAAMNTLAYVILYAPAAAIFREITGRVGAPASAPKPGQPWG